MAKKEKKQELDLVLIIGIVSCILAVLLLLYVFYLSIPKKGDLKHFPKVTVPQVENSLLENELNNLNKIPELPLEIKENLGKTDPYF